MKIKEKELTMLRVALNDEIRSIETNLQLMGFQMGQITHSKKTKPGKKLLKKLNKEAEGGSII